MSEKETAFIIRPVNNMKFILTFLSVKGFLYTFSVVYFDIKHLLEAESFYMHLIIKYSSNKKPNVKSKYEKKVRSDNHNNGVTIY